MKRLLTLLMLMLACFGLASVSVAQAATPHSFTGVHASYAQHIPDGFAVNIFGETLSGHRFSIDYIQGQGVRPALPKVPLDGECVAATGSVLFSHASYPHFAYTGIGHCNGHPGTIQMRGVMFRSGFPLNVQYSRYSPWSTKTHKLYVHRAFFVHCTHVASAKKGWYDYYGYSQLRSSKFGTSNLAESPNHPREHCGARNRQPVLNKPVA